MNNILISLLYEALIFIRSQLDKAILWCAILVEPYDNVEDLIEDIASIYCHPTDDTHHHDVQKWK
jgi:hypothetical protein